MNERELRIALVCYGGLSLAVYMHGISKELLKLVRASKVYHGARRSGADVGAGYDAHNDDPDRETDSERIYYALLNSIGDRVSLRAIVDVISGTSAGGINGIMLARALAHDLSLDAHREMWLGSADVTELMDPAMMPTRWSKAYVRPVLWGIGRAAGTMAPEVRGKLSTLVRSRWWSPPFSGRRFFNMLLDGMNAMGEAGPRNSLMPSGCPLSLSVTLTDLLGRPTQMTLHDPVLVSERSHRRRVEFRYHAPVGGEVVSDFRSADLPGLAFAARSTSSFAGLFPPMTVREACEEAARRGEPWQTVDGFCASKLGAPFDHVTDRPFVDGGVLDNKPFANAIEAVRGRPAHRQVARRLLFVEPNPESGVDDVPRAVSPTYLGVIRRAVTDIPREQPIGDELSRLESINAEIRSLKGLVARVRPRVQRLVLQALGDLPGVDASSATVARARRHADALARSEAGYAFQSYREIRLSSLYRELAARHAAFDDVDETMLAEELSAWAERHHEEARGDADVELWLLHEFDIAFRLRRVRFVVTRLNELHARTAASNDRATSETLNEVKTQLYRAIAGIEARAAQRSTGGEARLARALHALRKSTDATGMDEELDAMVSALCRARLAAPLRDELLLAYLGFGFLDVLTLPVTRAPDLAEMEEVKVVRMSPDDAVAIRSGGAKACLKSVSMGNFAGFFSREYRENDYLWGRLHAADRLVDLVLDAISDVGPPHGLDLREVKMSLFEAILDAERPHLTLAAAEIERIRGDIQRAPQRR